MAQRQAGSRMMAGVLTAVGLGVVWLTIAASLPTEQELSAREPVLPPERVSSVVAKTAADPGLDLSIPGVPSSHPIEPAIAASQNRSGSDVRSTLHFDSHAKQVARLRCEAEIAQLCPDSLEGSARMNCLERRAAQLAEPCQQQLHARFIKWRENRSRMLTACQEEVKRWCVTVKAAGGQILQCLRDHAQEVSDRCYETLPKGTVMYKQ
ncbi:cysteine rich repeat-containing protein [Petrachloros mirabilis]